MSQALQLLPPSSRPPAQGPSARELWTHFKKHEVPGLYQLAGVLQCVFWVMWPAICADKGGRKVGFRVVGVRVTVKPDEGGA